MVTVSHFPTGSTDAPAFALQDDDANPAFPLLKSCRSEGGPNSKCNYHRYTVFDVNGAWVCESLARRRNGNQFHVACDLCAAARLLGQQGGRCRYGKIQHDDVGGGVLCRMGDGARQSRPDNRAMAAAAVHLAGSPQCSSTVSGLCCARRQLLELRHLRPHEGRRRAAVPVPRR